MREVVTALEATGYHAIAAMASNRVIGRDGALPWRCPEDLSFFRATTLGRPILMGRKTWDSLGRPLPGRRNIVISRTMEPVPGMEIVRSLDDLDALDLSGPIFVIGGAEIYSLLIPRCTSVYLTLMPFAAEGDAWFPEFESRFPRMTVLSDQPGVAQWRHYKRNA